MSVVLAAPECGVEGFTKVRALGGIEEYRLDANGLTVLLAPDRAAAIRALTVEQVNAVIRTRVDPERAILVNAGTVGNWRP